MLGIIYLYWFSKAVLASRLYRFITMSFYTNESASSSEVISLKEESSTVQSLKDEFTQRIADAERKAQLACKERDIAKKVTQISRLYFPHLR